MERWFRDRHEFKDGHKYGHAFAKLRREKNMENNISEVCIVNDKDWFLEQLVTIVNKTEMAVGITLTAGGTIISGELVGGKQYFEEFAETFSSSLFPTDEEFRKEVKRTFEENAKLYGPESSVPTGFIHVKNCRFISTDGSSIPNNKGSWWRGKLSDVTGFTLGKMEKS